MLAETEVATANRKFEEKAKAKGKTGTKPV